MPVLNYYCKYTFYFYIYFYFYFYCNLAIQLKISFSLSRNVCIGDFLLSFAISWNFIKFRLLARHTQITILVYKEAIFPAKYIF